MYKKVQSNKQSFGLQKTAEKAKTLVTVKGLSEASAEGTHNKQMDLITCYLWVWLLHVCNGLYFVFRIVSYVYTMNADQ